MNSPPSLRPPDRSVSPRPVSRSQFAFGLMLLFILGSFFAAVLSILTLGFVGVVLGVCLLMAAFIASQYALWGWWLGAAIARAEKKREEAAEQ